METERPAFVAGFEQVSEALASASRERWPVSLAFRNSFETIGSSEAVPDIAVVSLFTELGRLDEPFEETRERLAQALPALLDRGIASVFLATIFRHVPGREPKLLERIRRLNLLVAELSNETGFDVIDIDRTVTHFGARDLETDYRLTGRVGAEVAGYAIASAVLAIGMEEAIDPDLRAAATEFHGPIWEMSKFVNRRLREAK